MKVEIIKLEETAAIKEPKVFYRVLVPQFHGDDLITSSKLYSLIEAKAQLEILNGIAILKFTKE